MKRLSISIAAAAFALTAFHSFHSNAGAQALPTAPPPPPAPNATVAPTLPPGALPTPASNTATISLPAKPAHATPAPPKDVDSNRVGLTGVWEVALQQPAGVVYTHFKIAQSGNILTGTYLDEKNKKYPLSGSVDGKDVRVVVSLPDGSDLVFKGSQDTFTDMVGTLDTAKDTIGFTAAYRPKYKWTDNLNPTPAGGMGGSGGGLGGGPGGGTPY